MLCFLTNRRHLVSEPSERVRYVPDVKREGGGCPDVTTLVDCGLSGGAVSQLVKQNFLQKTVFYQGMSDSLGFNVTVSFVTSVPELHADTQTSN